MLFALALQSYGLTTRMLKQEYILSPNSSRPNIPDQSTLAPVLSDGTVLVYTAFGNTYLFLNGTNVNGDATWEKVADGDVEGMVGDSVNASLVHGFVHIEKGWHYHNDYRYYGTVHYSLSENKGASFPPVGGDDTLCI